MHVWPRAILAQSAARTAGLVAIIGLQAYGFLQPDPLALRLLAALLTVLSILNPTSGLLAFAALAPLSTAIASVCGGPLGSGTQLIEQMALAVGLGTLVRGWRTDDGPTRIGAPALFIATV